MDYQWHDVLGTIGVGCIVGAYFLLQIGSLRPQQLRYSMLNAMGAALILVSLAYSFNASAALVEGFWLLISLYGVLLAVGRKVAAANAHERAMERAATSDAKAASTAATDSVTETGAETEQKTGDSDER
ncbi:MAG: hypothetical protein R3E12_05345 [Candidatus Eisenbacteria bacterium]